MRSKERKEGIKKERMKERIMIDRSFVSQKEGKKKKKTMHWKRFIHNLKYNVNIELIKWMQSTKNS